MKRFSGRLTRRSAGFLGLAALICAALLPVPSLWAEDEADASQAARAVRLSSIDGQVHLYQGDQPLADQAVANTPLFEGARIETGNDGRAEIQFEDGSVARISPESSLTLAVLRGLGTGEDRDAEMVLNSGLAYFELHGESGADRIRVRFGDTLVTAGGFTVLRINLDRAPGEVAVFSGNARVEGGAISALDLHGGQSALLSANEPSGYSLSESIEPDSWDAWNSDRDQELTTASAGRTDATNDQPDSQNPAWSDLDANGNWYNVPDQGYVWSPYEASSPDWDPYGTGYWMNSPSYGYMWVSGEPWGYLPYQCGAWNFYNSFGWGWAPGSCNPWWRSGGGWVINIVAPPPRYHFPVRPPRPPRSPRPVSGGHLNTPRLIAVNRHLPPGNAVFAPRDRSTPVKIGGTVVHPLRPIQTTRSPYNQAPVFSGRPVSPTTRTPLAVRPPDSDRPGVTSRPGYGVQNGSQPRRPVPAPARPTNTYTPPASRPAVPSAPRPSGGSFSPPPSRAPAPAPRMSAPAPHVSAPSGGARPSGGGPHH